MEKILKKKKKKAETHVVNEMSRKGPLRTERREGEGKYSRLTCGSKAQLRSFSLFKLIGRKLSGPVWRAVTTKKMGWCRLEEPAVDTAECASSGKGTSEQGRNLDKKGGKCRWGTREWKMLADVKEKNKLEKNRRDELREGKPALGDSSASTRYYVAAETNLYKRKTERRHWKSIARPREREREEDHNGIILRERALS